MRPSDDVAVSVRQEFEWAEIATPTHLIRPGIGSDMTPLAMAPRGSSSLGPFALRTLPTFLVQHDWAGGWTGTDPTAPTRREVARTLRELDP